jgi:hypothetical protein
MNWTAAGWFVAAALALAAVAIELMPPDPRLSWPTAAGSLLLAGLGVGAYRQPPPRH